MGALSALEHEPYRPAPRSLADIRDPDGDTYPVELLAGASTGLVLFAALWHGRQDAVHMADAGLAATCVDLDERRLNEMAPVYPLGWEFYVDDAYEFTADAAGNSTWDVVSLDPFTNDFERCAKLVDLWCSVARQAVILGTGSALEVRAPRGWKIALRRRRSSFAGGVDWVGLTRA